MKAVGIISSNVLSPLGANTKETFDALIIGISGVQKQQNGIVSASFSDDLLSEIADKYISERLTKLESLAVESIAAALENCDVDLNNPKTILILSTTKGNINLLDHHRSAPKNTLELSKTAEKIGKKLNAFNKPQVVSTACISGLLSIIIGQRLIRTGKYDHVVVCGVDLISGFVVDGFSSFMALSNEVCRPFDRNRKGINLGEAAATVVLSNDPQIIEETDAVLLGEGACTNDSNHISGPSRTGDELAHAIQRAMLGSHISKEDIGFVSAHGTATMYNDEMEAKAFHSLSLASVPVNSLKGFFGHTLGASGVLETIMSAEALKQDYILPTFGWEESGVSVPINVSNTLYSKPIKHFLKTSSGFGGCNAAMIFSKNDTNNQ